MDVLAALISPSIPGADWIFAGKRFRETSRVTTQNGPLVQETITLASADPFYYREP